MKMYDPEETKKATQELREVCQYKRPLPKWRIKASLTILSIGFLALGLAANDFTSIVGILTGGLFGVLAIFI